MCRIYNILKLKESFKTSKSSREYALFRDKNIELGKLQIKQKYFFQGFFFKSNNILV